MLSNIVYSLIPFTSEIPPFIGHFQKLFGPKTKNFIQKIIKERKPKLVFVCMLYYLDENKDA